MLFYTKKGNAGREMTIMDFKDISIQITKSNDYFEIGQLFVEIGNDSSVFATFVIIMANYAIIITLCVAIET
jgi:hypothetical protein